MALTMYQASIPVLAKILRQLGHVLDLAEAHAQEHKIDPTVLLNDRLYPDMFTLTRQVQIATDVAKAFPSRLAGVAPPSWEDTETSFAELKARTDRTVKLLEAVKPEAVDGSEDRTVAFKIRGNEISMPGREYLFSFVLANVHFHSTTAYAILRHNGVVLGKADYLGLQ